MRILTLVTVSSVTAAQLKRQLAQVGFNYNNEGLPETETVGADIADIAYWFGASLNTWDNAGIPGKENLWMYLSTLESELGGVNEQC